MKTITIVISILLILLCGTSPYADEQRVVRVGAFNYYPGIFKDTDGQVKGFYVDALADIAQRENIRFEYVYGSWSSGLDRLKSGEVDVLTSVAYTPERAKLMDYASTPLLTVWGELYAPLQSDIDRIRDVQGKKIAVMKGDINARHFIDLVKKFDISCNFIEMPGFDDVFKAIASKQVDAGVANSTFGAAKQKEYELRSTGVIFNPFDIFFTVSKGKNQDLLALFDNYLNSWRHDKNSVFNQSRQKWSHGTIGTMKIIPRWTYNISLALGALILVSVAFIAFLKREVRRKTLAITESKEKYKVISARQNAILAAVPDIIMEVDTSMVYTWSNQAGYDFFGDDVIGKSCVSYFVDEQSTSELVRPLFDGKEKVLYVESWQRRNDGEVRLLAWWCKALEDESGTITGTLSTARDITGQKQNEEALQKHLIALTLPLDDPAGIQFSDLFNLSEIQRIQDDFAQATGVASIITTPDGTPITNPSNFSRLCSEIIRKSEKGCANCLKSDAAIGQFNTNGPIIQRCLSGGLWDAGAALSIGGRHIANWLIGQVKNEEQDDEKMLEYADEIGVDRELFRAALAEVPNMSKEQFEKVASALYSFANELSQKAYQNIQQARFITERKKIEHELQSKNEELERFTYTVSHDLKSPLITIQSYSGMILKDMDTENYERARADIKRIEAAAAKMSDLLNDLLELSRIGRAMNTTSQIDMNRLVKDTLEQIAGSIGQSQVEIMVQPDLPTVRGDQKRIAEVMQNLIENAIKYMGDQTKPRIEIGTRQDSGELVFFVSDNGKGIDPLYHENIFGLFNKLDTKSQGTGVGLALVKRVIELHGGKVWVESEGTGNGSRFCFTVGIIN